jgi:hypothetical protein
MILTDLEVKKWKKNVIGRIIHLFFKILTINHNKLLFFHKLEMIQCFQVKLGFKFNYFILLWVPKTKVNS